MSEHLIKQPTEVREQEKRDVTPPSLRELIRYTNSIEKDLQQEATYHGTRRDAMIPMGGALDSLTEGERAMVAHYDKQSKESGRLSSAAYNFNKLMQSATSSEHRIDVSEQPVDADALKSMSEFWQNKALHSGEHEAEAYNGAAEFAATYADNYELIAKEIAEQREKESSGQRAA